MERGNVIRNKAEELAEIAYKKWGRTNIPRYLVGFKIKESKPADETIADLADYLEQNMLERYPEETYTERLEGLLNSAKPEDLLELISLNKSIDPRTVEYAAFKPLYNPAEGPDWYGMTQAELRQQMRKLGYDPDDGGQPELVRFLDALRTNAQRYERTKGVEDDMGNWRTVMASLVSPSATEEAVKQSLTGQYDDAKMDRAVSIDYLANSLMGAGLTGAVKMPENLVRGLRLPATVNVASTPARAAGIAAGVEEARQISNAIEGRDASLVGAPVGSALAAGTVPAAAQLISSVLAKGTDPSARVFSRGVARGLRNYDPLKAERAELKAQLIRAREINKSMPDKIASENPFIVITHPEEFAQTGNSQMVIKGPRSVTSSFDNASLAANESLEDAIEKLRYLGFPMKEDVMKNPAIPGRPYTVEDVIGSSQAMGSEYKSSGLSDDGFDLIEYALQQYDNPKLFQSFSTRGNSKAAPRQTYLRNIDEYNKGKSLFPAKTEYEIAQGTDPSTYKKGLVLGEWLGNLFGRVEPVTRVNPLNPADIGARLRGMQQRDWYRREIESDNKKKDDDEDFVVGKYRTHKLIGGE